MPDVKNVSGDDRWVPDLQRLVAAGELVKDVDDGLAASLGEQPDNWEVRKAKKAAAAENGESV